jgi:hypothetical protein
MKFTMNIQRLLILTISILIGKILVSMWVRFLSGLPVATRAASHTVCEVSPPTYNYSSTQPAVDAASDGTEIMVA